MAQPDLHTTASPAANSTVLAAQSVSYERFGESVFAPVSLSLMPGETIVLRGANGAGKTTLLRILAGLLVPSTGQVERTGDFHFLGHQSALKADLTVLENLAFGQRIAGQASDEKMLIAAIQRLDLSTAIHQVVGRLSAGQQRRTALARLALRLSTPLWLLDEPTSNLDQRGADQFASLLQEHADHGGAQIICSHRSSAESHPNRSELWLGSRGPEET